MKSFIHDKGDLPLRVTSQVKLDAAAPLPIDPAPEDYPATGDIVVLCGWCPQLHILRSHLGPKETLVIFLDERGPSQAHIYRAGVVDDHSSYKRLIVSHGICEPCKAAHFPTNPPEVKP